ncbi:TetR/AcrR family transcriptional regulator [Mucilaginibacter pallidiroseus]|uniref:TetR/AcrR family transcriptional regulator n=1 Tax=Mucilaginibacter pallidiroseus TaxID=2599295 RepID=A0A563U2X7_9SPHI|nr:TetR/AcrR family transcriptional regulator [Mucilaginibacter pallidiroseus]TWR25699.1 TetR/AcrR family transcriptional regulator [Mucilaginibacter pallidiroseus]
MENKDEKVRQKILAAAKTAFLKSGYNKVSMNDIAIEAGIGRSTLYYYYLNKQDTFNALMVKESKHIFEGTYQRISNKNSFHDNLHIYNRFKLDCIDGIIKKYELLMADLHNKPENFDGFKQEIRVEEEAIFKQLLIWGIQNHDVAPVSDEDIDHLASTLNTAVNSLQEETFKGEGVDTANRLAWLIRILSKGIK